MKHLVRSSSRQASCLLCGKPMFFSSSNNECNVTAQIRQALYDFATEHGKLWKSKLRQLWETGAADQVLMLARNVVGPKRLAAYKLRWIAPK